MGLYDDFNDVDWEEEQYAVVIEGARYGIPAAKKELARRNKLVDNLSD